MMSAATKKPIPDPSIGPRSSKDIIAPPNRSSTRSIASSSPTGVKTYSLSRNRSVRTTAPTPARSSAQRPAPVTSATTSTPDRDTMTKNSVNNTDAENDDWHRASVALVDDLKERLRNGEELSDQFQKQAHVLQLRLDEALNEQSKLEERVHECTERIEILENEKRDAIRQKREIEAIYENEKASLAKEREDFSMREEEMQTIIQRLKDSLNSRANGDEEGRINRRSNLPSPSMENGQFAPISSLQRTDSQNNSKLLLQKDRVIESLGLELAEAQIKLVEFENSDGNRFQEIEKQLQEVRVTNARLMEDNESYQLLLSESTLRGDFSKSEFMGSALNNADALGTYECRSEALSLADELSEAEGSENEKNLKRELKKAKEDNKALTLYINKIIQRLLDHQNYEGILDHSSESITVRRPDRKELPPSPPPPPPHNEKNESSNMSWSKSNMGVTRRPRPHSVLQSSSHSLVTDLGTAPSIPLSLSRSNSHRGNRPKSEQFTGGVARVVNQMYRSGHVSPPFHGPQTPRSQSQSFFLSNPPISNQTPAHRHLSSAPGVPLTNISGLRSETSSVSGDSGEVSTPSSNSPPRSEKSTTLAGNKPRPLRLLQESGTDNSRRVEEEAAGKSSKRSSWIYWALGKKGEGQTEETLKSLKE